LGVLGVWLGPTPILPKETLTINRHTHTSVCANQSSKTQGSVCRLTNLSFGSLHFSVSRALLGPPALYLVINSFVSPFCFCSQPYVLFLIAEWTLSRVQTQVVHSSLLWARNTTNFISCDCIGLLFRLSIKPHFRERRLTYLWDLCVYNRQQKATWPPEIGVILQKSNTTTDIV
jgi:hypothetical protein